MCGNIDKRALNQWIKSSISYKNYQEYLGGKNERFNLTLIDLLYIANFKGGNATVNEPVNIIDTKLESYSKVLNTISCKFGDMKLTDLNELELSLLIRYLQKVFKLTDKNCPTNIDGFGISFMSALLHAYFPELIPILDRRIIINLDIPKKEDVNKHGQIKKMDKFIRPVVEKFAELCTQRNQSVREVDKYLFTQKLHEVSR